MVIILIVIVSFLLIILGFVFLFVSHLITQKIKRKKNSLYLPNGEVTYADLHKPAKPLFSINYRLSGKPDYILHQDDTLIPVEYTLEVKVVCINIFDWGYIRLYRNFRKIKSFLQLAGN